MLLPLLGFGQRVTTDIDVAGLDRPDSAQTLELMRIAEELGLPVESINQAAAYFLSKHEPFDEHLLPLHRGPKAEILRPDLTLFVLLKLGRLTETDLSDCLGLIKKEGPFPANGAKKLLVRIATEFKKAEAPKKIERLKRAVG